MPSWTDSLQSIAAPSPQACDTYCADAGYFYYAVQWGIECW